MKVLITGGAGFIGSNLVRRLLAATTHEIVILDALTYAGGEDTIADVVGDTRVEFVAGDIADRGVVRTAMSGCDAVMHLAAESHVDRSLVDPDVFVRTNCLGTNVLCDVALELGLETFVHVSTDEVYGSRTEGSFTEEDPLRPTSPYSASKAASDMIALSYHRSFGLDVRVTRASNNYGPFQYPEKIIPLFTTRLIDGQDVPLYGEGLQVRDWLHVDDHCAALVTVLERGSAGGVYNIGGSRELTNLELTRRLLELTGREASCVTRVPDRPGHDFRYSISTGRLRELGWTPEVGIEKGLAATVEWYRSNRWWWEPRRAAPAMVG